MSNAGRGGLDVFALRDSADNAVRPNGGTGGTAISLTLATGEAILSGTLCWAEFNGDTRHFYALFTTSAGRTLTTRVLTASCATMTAPAGFGIVGFFGQDGDEMDQLGCIYAKQ
ncbi:hypothetical protein DFH08DRAFT_965339 [Mycena albidolilacea]|uniref:Jacalin-type lectin domain-containing protein n=1 Tax=Mycena albidolilacea TaxID=1033008 RepID=A0AAD7ELT3_9AGAR|nr:hypothetical protein DFH08DRAFT_965339 [Mycena albidolilacea]